GLIALLRQHAAHDLETQVEQERVDHVDLAVIADRLDLAAPVSRPHLGAADALLAGQARKARELIERREVALVIGGELVHQVEMPRVVAAGVIVEAEALVLVAALPEARAAHAVDE